MQNDRETEHYLKAWRRRRGLNQETLAAAVGMSHSNLGRIERGLVPLSGEHVGPLARALDIQPGDLWRNPEESPTTDSVPVVGYVGAGAVTTLYAKGDGDLSHVEAPRNRTLNTVAAEIRGLSLGPAFDHGLVFYDDVRDPVTEDLYGRLCVVGLDDGRVLVKILKPAGDGSFHLLSNTAEEPLLNQAVAWAARVKEVRPR